MIIDVHADYHPRAYNEALERTAPAVLHVGAGG